MVAPDVEDPVAATRISVASEDRVFAKAPATHFELIDSTALKNGMAILTYRIA